MLMCLYRSMESGKEFHQSTPGLHDYPRDNSLAPGRCGSNLKEVIFKLKSSIDILSISCGIALRWLPQVFTDD